MTTLYIATLEEDENGELILPIPDDLIVQLGWSTGDEIQFEVQDKAIILTNITSKSRQDLVDSDK